MREWKPTLFRCDILIGITIWNSDNNYKKSLFDCIAEEEMGKKKLFAESLVKVQGWGWIEQMVKVELKC